MFCSKAAPISPPLRQTSRRWAVFGLAILRLAFLPDAPAAEPESSHDITLSLLEKRKALQATNALRGSVFYGFQLSNRLAHSQITFRHRIVDDAGRDYKAAHYDHGNGFAVADIDGDQLLDIYFTTQLGTNELWRNLGAGRFENITGQAGVGLVDQIVVTGAFGDIDNDGDPDLFVTTVRHGNHLFENLGSGKFRDITEPAGVAYSGHSSGITFLDFNRDGRLDLFVANVGVYTTNERGKGGFYIAHTDAFSGHLFPDRTEAGLLYESLGHRRFREVSQNLNLRNSGWNGDATFADLNQDGFPELYLVNMQGDDHFYENDQGRRFVDRTANYFPQTSWGAMGVKFFDFNQDGLFDLFVTDMHSDMTKRQTEQALNFMVRTERTKSEAFCLAQWTEEYLQGASNNIFGNSFYMNVGEGKFREISDRIGVETYWPWGMSVGDLNADGYEDICVTAGMGYPFRYAVNSVLMNERGRGFFDVEFLLGVEPRLGNRTEQPWFTLDCGGADRESPLCAGRTGMHVVSGSLSSRSSVMFDLDNDGDLDLVILDFNDHPQIFMNNLSERKRVHYLKVQLVGTASNRDGLGATVRVKLPGRQLNQFHDGKSGYLSQSALPLYFGLGDQTQIDAIEVLWPSGRKQVLTKDLKADTLMRITEP